MDSLTESFLLHLKYIFVNNQITSAVDCYRILSNMLKNGCFSMVGKIYFDDNFNYLHFSNMECAGIQVMHGTCCCRHVCAFINDMMLMLGFDVSLYYVHIDNSEIWTSCEPIGANHVTILLKENNEEYILDPMNKFLLKRNIDNSLMMLDLGITSLDLEQFLDFSDDHVKGIGKVLKKYYCLRSLGINHICE